MTTAAGLPAREKSSTSTIAVAAALVAALVAMTAWAATAGGDQSTDVTHLSPATVEHVPGEHVAWVTLTELGARKIGLQLTEVPRSPAEDVVVPYAALVHDADGTVWVYASDDRDSLRFRRHEVVVGTIDGDRATLRKGPPPGTWVAGHGSAELYGTEFEVGH